MKAKFFILILILLLAATLTFVACNKEDTPMENEKKPLVTIEMHGKIGEKAVANPSFDWSATEANAKFAVSLKNEEGEVIYEKSDTTETHYASPSLLEEDKNYVFTVTELISGETAAVSFHTTDEAGDPETEITACDPFCEHMVIQRGRTATLAGTAARNSLLTLDYFGTRLYSVTDGEGKYEFTLPAKAAVATPTDLEIRLLPENTLVLEDVLIGDVYLASGQSNMWWKLRDSDYDQTTDVDNAINSDMRYFSMSITRSSTPRESVANGKWSKISRLNSSYKDYSAIAFMTGSMVAAEAAKSGIPIGIIQAAEGDTNIANWMSKEYYNDSIGTKNQNYNAMIYPLHRAELAGVIWYQGCNNSAKGSEYAELLKGLFANWRELFRNETLPFYVVQLPVYDDALATEAGRSAGNPYDFSYVRESQALACAADDNAYLIATCDGGDPSYIHPTEKRYICERITKSILSTLYGADYTPQGPTYNSHVTQGNKAIITVDNGEGLHVKSGEAIRGFMLAGADGKYFDAAATIEEGKIVVTSDKVAAPVYIKYGFSKCPFLNVYNKDGFLMSPFRSDDHNRNIDLLDYREGAEYRLNAGGSTMRYETVTVDGEIGLRVTKTDESGDKGYGILELDKYGAIGYNELDVEISVIGTNSGAQLSFRIVEGSGEVWSIGMTDNFIGKRTVTLPTSAFQSSGTASDGVIDFQKVKFVDLVVRKSGTVSVTILGVRFVETERTAPRAFTINEAKNDGHEVTVKYAQAGFANSYRVIVSSDGANYSDPVYDQTVKTLSVTFDPALLTANTYYVKVVAKNELGETVATNSGMVVATIDLNGVASFMFDSDAAFESYKSVKISNVHSKLTLSRSEKGLKVNVQSGGDGWMDFIVKMEKGANKGYDSLKVYLDLLDYKGTLMIQLQDEAGNSYNYTVDTSGKRDGWFTIPLSSFKKKDGNVAFDGHDLVRLKFGLTDYVGGDDDNLYIKSIEFAKA